MSLNTIVLRLRHSGKIGSTNRANLRTIYLPDILEHYEGQSRSSKCYIRPGTYIDIPLTNKVTYSLTKGTIKKFVEAGYLIANTFAGRPGNLYPFPLGYFGLALSDTVRGPFTSADAGKVIYRYLPLRYLSLTPDDPDLDYPVHRLQTMRDYSGSATQRADIDIRVRYLDGSTKTLGSLVSENSHSVSRSWNSDLSVSSGTDRGIIEFVANGTMSCDAVAFTLAFDYM